MPQKETLVLGTRRYSSWSMRGWLCVRLAGWDVDTEWVRLAGGGQTKQLKDRVPNGSVPFMQTSQGLIWDSLAVALMCAERKPSLWPQDVYKRAWAYSITAQIHSGLRPLRSTLHMNLGRHRPYHEALPDDVVRDIQLIDHFFCQGTQQFGTPFLGNEEMGIADAFYAPVITRLKSYQLLETLSAPAQTYMARILRTPLVRQWYREADEEPLSWQLERYEALP